MRDRIALVLAATFALSGCISVIKPIGYATPLRPVVTYTTPAQIEVASPPQVVIATAPPAAPTFRGLAPRDAIAAAGFDPIGEETDASAELQATAELGTIESAMGRRGDTAVIATRWTLRDAASAQAFAQNLVGRGLGVVVLHVDVVAWVVSTPNDTAIEQQIAARMAG